MAQQPPPWQPPAPPAGGLPSAQGPGHDAGGLPPATPGYGPGQVPGWHQPPPGYVYPRSPKRRSRAVVLALVVAGAGVVLGGGYALRGALEGSPPALPEPRPEHPLAVKLATLLADYQSNEVRADVLYKGKWIQTSGALGELGKDLLGDSFVRVGNAEGFLQIPSVDCYVDADTLGRAARLKKGARVTVTGKVQGLLLHVLVRDCALGK